MPSLDPTEELRAVPLGTRVVVRWALRPGMPHADGIHSYTDALGHLTERTEGGVTVSTKRGDVMVAWADILAAKQVPDAPAPRPRSRKGSDS